MIGRKLGGRYEIVQRLGAGGMGVVYRAHDTLLGRSVAVKLLRPELAADAEFLRRFRREAKAAASLSHPNIVSVFDVGQEEDLHYLVMEYVPGPTLQQRLAGKPLSAGETVAIASQVAAALEHAHSHDVVHRDIKPQNILLGPDGQVKVADFGIARAGVASTLTHTGSIVGSVYYLAPEQVEGSAGGRQADIYALGVVMYQMLTGHLPFQGDTPISVALKHIQENPLPPRKLAPHTPPALERVVLRALRKDPEQRYNSAAEMMADMQEANGSARHRSAAAALPVGGEVEGVRAHSRHAGTRRPRLVAWIAVSLLLIAAVVYGGFALSRWWFVPVLTTPNVLRQDIAVAQDQLRGHGLEYAVVGQQYSAEIEVSHVIDQDPAPGEPIKKGGLVKLWLSLGPELVRGGVPAVEGKSLREAEETLRSAGLEVRTTYRHDAQVPADAVITQEPRAGTPALKGSAVELLISQGPEPQPVTVPAVYGLTADQAVARLKEAGLGVDTIEEGPNALAKGLIYGQSPLAGETATQGALVKLQRSKGTELTVHRSLVMAEVPGKEGESHLVRVEVQDQLGTTVVFSGVRTAGTFPVLVTWAGESASVRVISDGQAVSEQSLSG